MSAPRRGAPLSGPGASSRPALIAHGGGNSAAGVRESLAGGAAVIEVDLWARRGRLEARHDRRVPGPLPLLYEFWYLKPAPRRTYYLEDLLEACRGRAGVFLDLKNGLGQTAPILRRVLAGHGRGVHAVASSQNWPLLREVGLACPHLDLYYSIDTLDQFDLFRSVVQHDVRPVGVSCRHSLLDRDVIADFHDAGLAVVAWTVDDGDRARELASWSVDAITSNRVGDVRAALDSAP